LSERDEEVFRKLVDDAESDWPDRLLERLAQAPLVEESILVKPFYRNATRDDLSEEELEVLRYVSYGLEASHVADLIEVSEHTVKTHLRAARFRLKAKNTLHACCLALREGLFE
jgi:DNA-binding NarL/FixJ family response regulator